MPDLQKFTAKICYTAVGFLVHQDKILLIKHKKAGMWFCPGGHVDEGELPHQTAEREFWEETGIKVKAINFGLQSSDKERNSLPNPFHSNLHWVCKNNYEARISNPKSYKPVTPWIKGCEMHFGMSYLVKLIGSDKFRENVEETDGIGWFSEDEAMKLVSEKMIRAEINFAFQNV
jgi:8-oxo-dGTP pyrophosphatase MutT (NUDIX family)